MKKYSYFILLFVCLFLCACSNDKLSEIKPDTDNLSITEPQLEIIEEKESAGVISVSAAILPERDKVKEVLIFVSRSFSGEAYAYTNDGEREAILDKLYEADLSKLKEAEPTGVMGASVSFKLCSKSEEAKIRLTEDNDFLYFLIERENQRCFYKCEKGVFDFAEIDRIITATLGNTEDPRYSGSVELKESDFSAKVNKINTVIAVTMLNEAISNSEKTDADENEAYDVVFAAVDVLYEINSNTGDFFIEEGGEKKYAQLDMSSMIKLKTVLGIKNATVNGQ